MKILSALLTLFALSVLVLGACTRAAEPAPTQIAEQPDPTLPPTQPPPPPPSPTPAPFMFFDDFNGTLAAEWQWTNEDPLRWSITPDGWLAIQAGNPALFDQSGQTDQINLLYQDVPPGDIILTTHLIAQPDENFNQAGIFLIIDPSTYIAILNAYCLPCLPDSQGYGIFIESFKQGEYISQGKLVGRPAEQTEHYLRLVYSASAQTVTGYFATTPGEWQLVGVIEAVTEIRQVALGAANTPSDDGVKEDLSAYFDYIEITQSESPARPGSAPPQPSATPEPTALPITTPLPEGILFRDDFEGYLQPGWSWINENPAKWALVDFDGAGMLKITGDKPGGLAVQSNTLMRALPEGDFVLTAHVLSEPRQNFHQANIFIFQDATNFIRLNLGFCDVCGLPTGNGYFMETIIDNNPFEDVYKKSRDAEDTDVYLRLVNQAGSITGYYATEFGNWQKIGAFGNYFAFKSVGLGATNSTPEGWEVEDLVALFDYFEISLP